MFKVSLIGVVLAFGCLPAPGASEETHPATLTRFGLGEFSFAAEGEYRNPYLELEAEATLLEPDGRTTRSVPLFWDGGRTWRFRFSPDKVGDWRWTVRSVDPGLAGRTGHFVCTPSALKGSIQAAADSPRHFEYQDGERLWFLGDTAWALLCNNAEEENDRPHIEQYLRSRRRQGFNVVQVMMASEIGWGNEGGPPWRNLAAQEINPAYFAVADSRIAFANEQGLVVGIAVAWAYKGRNEPYAWNRFPDQAARERYARYVAARYAAYHTYFLVSGEWDSEIRSRHAPEAAVQAEFVRLGDVIRAADPQRRMMGIHPTQKHAGSVREFNDAARWMDFGDYQQNYLAQHASVLDSRRYAKPVVNGEYAYWLRDHDGDRRVDKAHSYSLPDIRAATWDIVMAGGYVVAGFGSTYLGGARHRTKFLPDDPENVPWLQQLAVIQQFFSGLEYWTLEPHDELVTSDAPRTGDRSSRVETGDVHLTETRGPAVTYWCLAAPGNCHVAYVRGTTAPVTLALARGNAAWSVEQIDPRTGERLALGELPAAAGSFRYAPPDDQDWVVVVRAKP